MDIKEELIKKGYREENGILIKDEFNITIRKKDEDILVIENDYNGNLKSSSTYYSMDLFKKHFL